MTKYFISPAPSMTDGLLVLVQLVIAAMTTAPWLSWNSTPSKDNLMTVFVFSSVNPKPFTSKRNTVRTALIIIIGLFQKVINQIMQFSRCLQVKNIQLQIHNTETVFVYNLQTIIASEP